MSTCKKESASPNSGISSTDNNRGATYKNLATGNALWTDGLLCAFEYVSGHKKKHRFRKSDVLAGRSGQGANRIELLSVSSRLSQINVSEGFPHRQKVEHVSKEKNDDVQGHSLFYDEEPAPEQHMLDTRDSQMDQTQDIVNRSSEAGNKIEDCFWVPIGWTRLLELVNMVQVNTEQASQLMDSGEEDDSLTVADVAAPYRQRAVGPTWWCHVMAGHPVIDSWLKKAQWLHPAISTALRDESRLISERMKHLYYEVPVRVAGGLLFELLGQSIGDPQGNGEDVPIVLRSWQTQNCLLTSLHVKGTVSDLNVLGILEVQDLLLSEGSGAPKTVYELIAHLALRLARWDDRLFRKYVFGEADEIELKFVSRRNREDSNLLSIILNQEIKRLSTEVIRVKWSLHAREEIVFELSEHLRGRVTQEILSKVRKSTREMIQEQEAVRDRLFTVQDVMQNHLRSWLQDKSLRISHNLTVFGGGGLVLSIITGLFGINVDGIPGAENTPYAFALFTVTLLLLGAALIGFGILYFGLGKPITEEQMAIRKMELQDIVKHFQHDAESHAKVRKSSASNHSEVEDQETLIDGVHYVLLE